MSNKHTLPMCPIGVLDQGVLRAPTDVDAALQRWFLGSILETAMLIRGDKKRINKKVVIYNSILCEFISARLSFKLWTQLHNCLYSNQ